MNYEFNSNEWLPRFPLRESNGKYSAGPITSPSDICNLEWLRRELSDQYNWGEPVPVDIFVMSDGEPEIRSATKIGGLPYRPANDRWPVTQSNKPMAFIAQLNFSNSKDIVGDPPGDLLLVFGDEAGDWYDKEFHLEWQSLGISNLVEPSSIPHESSWPVPCYGNIFRTMSYPNAKRRTAGKYPICNEKEVWSEQFIPTIQATQIGRAPLFVQEDDALTRGLPLCTIASVEPDLHQPYPWVNVPEPLCREGEWNYACTERYLMIGDAGCIYIFMEVDGTLHIGDSCY